MFSVQYCKVAFGLRLSFAKSNAESAAELPNAISRVFDENFVCPTPA